MSRFGNLEFEGKAEPNPRQTPASVEFDHFAAEAWLAFLEQRHEQSLRHYSKLLEIDPSRPEGWLGQVQVLIDASQLQAATSWLAKTPREIADHPQTLALRAMLAARLEDPAGAMGLSETAVSKDPKCYLSWLARGEALLSNSDTSAHDCFEKATLSCKDQWWVSLLISRSYAAHHQMSRALKHASAAQSADPTQSMAWAQVGWCHFQLGMVQDSKRALHRALELDASNRLAINMLGDIAGSSPLEDLKKRLKNWFSR